MNKQLGDKNYNHKEILLSINKKGLWVSPVEWINRMQIIWIHLNKVIESNPLSSKVSIKTNKWFSLDKVIAWLRTIASQVISKSNKLLKTWSKGQILLTPIQWFKMEVQEEVNSNPNLNKVKCNLIPKPKINNRINSQSLIQKRKHQ